MISISGNGQYILLIPLCYSGIVSVSADFGVTWSSSKLGNMSTIYSCSLSYTGQYQIFCGTNIWISNNYGYTFSSPLCSCNWKTNCNISNNGQYIWFQKTGSASMLSTDYGISFTSYPNTLVVLPDYRTITSDSTGQYMICTAERGPNVTSYGGCGIYYSTNYGATWTFWTNFANIKGDDVFPVAMSSNGIYQVTINDNTGLHQTLLPQYSSVLTDILTTSSNDLLITTPQTNILGNINIGGDTVFSKLPVYLGSNIPILDSQLITKSYVDRLKYKQPFININDINYAILNIDNNFTFTENTQTVILPTNLLNGSTIYLNNMTDHNISIESLAKIYHYVLTPIEGLNTLILYPNMLLTFIFTINTVSGKFKWNII
jgi:hypothetical protein